MDAGAVTKTVESGAVPVIAPIGLLFEGGRATGQLLNVNADTAAGAIAAALGAKWLGVHDGRAGRQGTAGVFWTRCSDEESRKLIGSGVIEGGMIPKVRACRRAAEAGGRAVIIDGREEHALLSLIDGAAQGNGGLR